MNYELIPLGSMNYELVLLRIQMDIHTFNCFITLPLGCPLHKKYASLKPY